MPLYRCTYPPDALDDHRRAAIATAITDIHCELTGAPPTFVHVQFFERAPTAGAAPFSVHGGIRAGRDATLVDALIERCCTSVATIAGRARHEVTMRTSETNAAWVWEGGRVFPEPGQEAAWLAARQP